MTPVTGAGASSVAAHIDLLFAAITAITVFFTGGIFVAVIFLAARYRLGAKVDRSHPPAYGHLIEIVWTAIPLAIAMGIFAWSSIVFFRVVRVPPGAMEIHVVGKQWMWKLQQPNGRWEMNQLHVPAGRPVVLTMTSEDVLHAFFIPAFRLKQDVVPGRFTQMWFEATRPGTYHLFCAEFCGTQHSTMNGTVTVMEPADYERWLTEGNIQQTVAEVGARLFRRHGCSGCHAGNASVRAPLLDGKFGRPVPVQIRVPGVPLEQTEASTRIFNARYIHDSIVLPEKEVAAGFKPIMPTFKNRLPEEEIFKLVAYIRSLGSEPEGSHRNDARQDNSGRLTEEDYRARTGFVPKNLEEIQRLTATGGNAGVAAVGTRGPRPVGEREGNPR